LPVYGGEQEYQIFPPERKGITFGVSKMHKLRVLNIGLLRNEPGAITSVFEL